MKWGMSAMLSKTLSFNRGITVQNLRHVGWIGLVHLLVLLAAVPLQLIMLYTRREQNDAPLWNNLFEISGSFQAVVVFTFPVLLAIFLFRYMQVKSSADFMHSLPIRRKALFYQHTALGAFLLVIPVVVTALITLILYYTLGIDVLFSATDIFQWAGEMCLMELFVFFVAVWIGMMTGMSVLQGGLTYILLLFPAGISVLLLMNMTYLLTGFAADYYLNRDLEHIIPFFRFMRLGAEPFAFIETFVYLFLIIVCYVLSLWLYQKRHSEAASQALAFPVLRPVFKYGVAFCTMLVGGFYFGETQQQFGWIIFGYMTFSIVGFFVAEMIIEKTWRVFDKWKGYLYFFVAMLIVGTLLHFDITGYEKRIPELGEIEQVYFGDSVYDFIDKKSEYVPYIQLEQVSQFLKEKENIKNVYLFHQQLIEDQPMPSSRSTETRYVVIGYILKNGDRMIRSYEVPVEQYKSFYRPIMESKEYKKNYYFLLRDKGVSPVRQVTMRKADSGEETVVLTEPKQVESFLTALKADLQNESVDSMLGNVGVWGDIELLQSDGDILHVTWKKSYMNVEQWLKQQRLLSKARLTAEDVDYAIVVKNKNIEGKPLTADPRFIQRLSARTDVVRITDKRKIDECLRQSSSPLDERHLYIIIFYRSDGSDPQLGGFDEKNVPSFIREQLQ